MHECIGYNIYTYNHHATATYSLDEVRSGQVIAIVCLQRRAGQYRKAPSDTTSREEEDRDRQVIVTYRVPTQTMKLEK